MTTATKRVEWDMAHRVPLHGGKCKTPHGHRYAAEIEVRGVVDGAGFVLDFGAIKLEVGGWIDEHLDHTTAYQEGDELMEAFSKLNTAAGLKPFFKMRDAPTAENLAELIGIRASELLGDHAIKVVVYETPSCWATWTTSMVDPWPNVRGRDPSEGPR